MKKLLTSILVATIVTLFAGCSDLTGPEPTEKPIDVVNDDDALKSNIDDPFPEGLDEPVVEKDEYELIRERHRRERQAGGDDDPKPNTRVVIQKTIGEVKEMFR